MSEIGEELAAIGRGLGRLNVDLAEAVEWLVAVRADRSTSIDGPALPSLMHYDSLSETTLPLARGEIRLRPDGYGDAAIAAVLDTSAVQITPQCQAAASAAELRTHNS